MPLLYHTYISFLCSTTSFWCNGTITDTAMHNIHETLSDVPNSVWADEYWKWKRGCFTKIKHRKYIHSVLAVVAPEYGPAQFVTYFNCWAKNFPWMYWQLFKHGISCQEWIKSKYPNTSNYHIWVPTKCPICCRRHFQIHLSNKNDCSLIETFQMGLTNNH